MRTHHAILVTIICLVAGDPRLHAEFIPLGGPAAPAGIQIRGLSANGAVVVGETLAEGFRWTQAIGWESLGIPPQLVSTGAVAANADGSVIVGQARVAYLFRRNPTVVLWRPETGYVEIPELTAPRFDPGGTAIWVPHNISADGATIVGTFEEQFALSSNTAFLWSGALSRILLYPQTVFFFGSSTAEAASADGTVVVGSRTSRTMPFPFGTLVTEAFRWTANTGPVPLGDLPGGAVYSAALDTSADGLVAVGVSNSSLGNEAFRWSAAQGIVGLGFLSLPGPGVESVARAVSADGSIIVGRSQADNESSAFIWDATQGMRSLHDVLAGAGDDLTGWILTDALDVSADGGTILGIGVNPAGQQEGWIARFVRPCPLGQGFWKNNPAAWPVTALTLGSQTYTQAELLALLHTPPRGDASVILAHQLIAAKVNIANGSKPTPVSAIIAGADSLLSGFTGKLPYHVRPSSATGQRMVNDATSLDSYNNGELTPDCTP